MGFNVSKPDRYDEFFESANRLRTEPGAPNPFVTETTAKERQKETTGIRQVERKHVQAVTTEGQ
jgi:hypothetical protein